MNFYEASFGIFALALAYSLMTKTIDAIKEIKIKKYAYELEVSKGKEKD